MNIKVKEKLDVNKDAIASLGCAFGFVIKTNKNKCYILSISYL